MSKLSIKVMAFCEELRLSGKTNMFGAVPYIQKEFDIDSSEAKNYLKLYFQSFKNR